MREYARNLSFMGEFSFYAAAGTKASAPGAGNESGIHRMMWLNETVRTASAPAQSARADAGRRLLAVAIPAPATRRVPRIRNRARHSHSRRMPLASRAAGSADPRRRPRTRRLLRIGLHARPGRARLRGGVERAAPEPAQLRRHGGADPHALQFRTLGRLPRGAARANRTRQTPRNLLCRILDGRQPNPENGRRTRRRR